MFYLFVATLMDTHQGVAILQLGEGFTVTIYQTNIEFQTITTDFIGAKAFNQVNCTTTDPPSDDDICIRCINEGYECDRCPYTQSPDKCTQCADIGYDDCEKCPLLTKLIRPTSIKVEYNHPALSNTDLSSDAILIKVTERSFRTLYNDQVLATHKTLNTIVGDGIITNTPLTHVMEIELGDQWVNDVTLDVVKGNIQTMLIDQIASAGITSPEMQLAFAEAVVEIAANDWGGTSASLDDGSGGQTPTPSSLPINNPDMFSMQLTYADGHAMVNSPIQKNGNISGMIWQTPGRNTQSYSFEYDKINRLKNAYHQDVISGGLLSTDNKYGMEVTYDKVGNIQTLNRRGVIDICPTPTPTFEYGAIDALSYNYVKAGGKTNRLQSIEEFSNIDHGFKSEGGDYAYDGFGNMTIDAKTGATIDYNHLNLPKTITADEGSITIVYDAAGIKLKKIVSGADGYIMHYIGGIEYRDYKMESIHHAEGRITFHENTDTEEEEPLYEYYLKDHLGNVRITLADKDGDGYIEPFNVNPDEKSGTSDAPTNLASTEVSQETHYYPFGMTMEGEWQDIVNGPENKYLYNGKELNTDFDLNWSDYGARYYDAAIGRWGQVDPLSDHPNQIDKSVYAYAWNDPVRLNDPDGKCPQCGPGFVIGFLADVTVQAGTNWYMGNNEGINWTQATISGLAGAASGGLSSLANAGKIGVKTLAVSEAVFVPAAESMAKQIESGSDLSFEQTTSDVLMGNIPGKNPIFSNKNIKNKEIDLTNKTRYNKNNPSNSRAKDAKEAKKTLDNSNNANGFVNGVQGNALQNTSDLMRSMLPSVQTSSDYTPLNNYESRNSTNYVVPLIDINKIK